MIVQRIRGRPIVSVLTALNIVVMILVILKLNANFSQDWPDQPMHPLVVIAVDSENDAYSVEVRSTVDQEGHYGFTVHLLGEAESDSGESRPSADLQIVVLGVTLDGVFRCDGDSPARSVSEDELSPGPAEALDLDRTSGIGSALFSAEDAPEHRSRGGSQIQSAPGSARDDGARHGGTDIVQYDVHLVGWFADETPASGHSMNDDGAVFVQGCDMDSPMIWANSANRPTDSAFATFAAPQFNVTYIDEETSSLPDLSAYLSMHRPSGATLAESYPSPVVSSYGWGYWYDTYWVGSRSLAYTDQPTWLITNRDVARSNDSWLFFGGMALAFQAALFVDALKALFARSSREPIA